MLRVFGKNKVRHKFVDKTFVCMRSHGKSTKSLFNIFKSNYEVYLSFKLNNLSFNIFYLLKKIFRKLIQIRL